MSDFALLAQQVRANSVAHGFGVHGDQVRAEGSPDALAAYYGNRLMLIIGEVAEAHEELRTGHAMNHVYFSEGKPEGVPVELADIIIRTMDLAEECGIDLEREVLAKMQFNASRPYKHGKKF